jgi:hypothetical protein
MQTQNDNTQTPDAELDDDRTIEGSITEVKPLDHSLAVLNPDLFAKTLFEPDFEKLASLKRSASRAKVDIATMAGMAKAQELETAFVKVRTSGDKKKTEFKKPLDQAGKKILEQFNALAEAAKAEEKKWTDIITAEKTRLANIEEEKRQLERARIEAIEGRIEAIRLIPSTLTKTNSATIEEKLNELVARALDPADFQEHLEVAIGAQNTAINELRQLLTETRDREKNEAELTRLRAEEQQRKAAAEATQRQADQMAAIMEVQGLANKLTAAGENGNRATVEAALAKVKAFNPADYGAMAPMAQLARDAAVPALEQMLANPAFSSGFAEAAGVAPIEADGTGVTIGSAVVNTGEAAPDAGIVEGMPAGSMLEQALAAAATEPVRYGMGVRRVTPKLPTDLEVFELVRDHFHVTDDVALNLLAEFDADGVRAALVGQA